MLLRVLQCHIHSPRFNTETLLTHCMYVSVYVLELGGGGSSCVVLHVFAFHRAVCVCQLLVVSALFLTSPYELCCPVTFPEDHGTKDRVKELSIKK